MRRGVYSFVWEIFLDIGYVVVAWAYVVVAWACVKAQLSWVCRTGLDGRLGFVRALGFFARGPI